ncbi:LOW QUALITY PROTEIN: hypothetical protein V1478_014648, partial [Vespula squamosa]
MGSKRAGSPDSNVLTRGFHYSLASTEATARYGLLPPSLPQSPLPPFLLRDGVKIADDEDSWWPSSLSSFARLQAGTAAHLPEVKSPVPAWKRIFLPRITRPCLRHTRLPLSTRISRSSYFRSRHRPLEILRSRKDRSKRRFRVNVRNS